METELGPTCPEAIFEFLLQEHHEPYPYAKLVALLTLCSWMRWPDDQELIEDAQVTAAASIYLHAKEKGATPTIPMNIDRLARSISIKQISGPYYEAFLERNTICDLIGFFLHCPGELKPSLNRAYDFVKKGGFLSPDATHEDRSSMVRARSTLKIAWKEQAIAGPLLYVCQPIDDDDSGTDGERAYIYDYAPDDPNCFDEAERFVQNQQSLLNLFGEALYCQQKLQRLLDSSSMEKLRFPKFPKAVIPIDPGYGTFDDSQLAIARTYRAPQ